MSADTVIPDYADPQSLNRYSYVRNNPLVYVDPTGHFLVTIAFQGSAGAGVGAAGGKGKWFNITLDRGINVEYGNFWSVEGGSHVGISAGVGGEMSFLFTNDWNVLNGLYMTHGGSGGVIGKFGADFLQSFSADGIVWGLAGSASFGGGGERHVRAGYGKASKTGSVSLRFY